MQTHAWPEPFPCSSQPVAEPGEPGEPWHFLPLPCSSRGSAARLRALPLPCPSSLQPCCQPPPCVPASVRRTVLQGEWSLILSGGWGPTSRSIPVSDSPLSCLSSTNIYSPHAAHQEQIDIFVLSPSLSVSFSLCPWLHSCLFPPPVPSFPLNPHPLDLYPFS